jgi:hypothetical protein
VLERLDCLSQQLIILHVHTITTLMSVIAFGTKGLHV